MKKHLTVFAGMTIFALSTCVGVAQSTNPTGQDPTGQNPTGQNPMRQDPTRQNPTTLPDRTRQEAQDKMNQGKDSANRLMGADSTFAMKAAQGGMAEVQLGTLAKEKAASEDVKKFGQQMVDDHGKANEELKQLAATKGITLPSSINAKQQSLYDKLSKLSGAEFDRAYMKEMVADHKTDVNEFRKQSEKGTDPELKAFAAKTLPTLESHLQMAQSTDNAVRTEAKK